MAYRERPPHPRLARFVEALCGSDDADRPAPRAAVRVVPDGCCELLFSASGSACTAELYGTKTRALLVRGDAPVENVSVRFRPGAVARFFALGGEALGDGVFELRALWGPTGGELAERIGVATSFEARFELLERALLARLAAAESPDRLADAIDAAARRLAAPRGRASVARVAARVGLGERRLERAFRARIGVSPKRLARILRFRAAYAALARGAPGAQVALACGYVDQSHLLREFRDFAGAPPREVLGRVASDSSNTARARSASL